MKLAIIAFFCSLFLLAGCGLMPAPGLGQSPSSEPVSVVCAKGFGPTLGVWTAPFLSGGTIPVGQVAQVDSSCKISFAPATAR